MSLEGMEDLGLDTERKVTLSGEPGYAGAWDTQKPAGPSDRRKLIRDIAIERATIDELEKAVDRLKSELDSDPHNAEKLEAVARVRAKLDSMIQKGQM